ncbi:MAG: DUF3793 family protein [Lachnospiraceae bacterium]|nr:DUF3793 family protein [Lachnospiraceae bacterium]
MIENLVTRFCSPTLAGLKTGSLFTVRDRRREELTEDLRKLNRILTRKGLRALLFTAKCGNSLVYIYRPDLLKRDLSSFEAEKILKDKGYLATDSTERCIVQLARRISNDNDFPHEIGLFLGYPPTDVKCFMENSRDGVTCSGCWKAYGNKEEAEKIFALYRKCTNVYCRKIREGVRLEKLIV